MATRTCTNATLSLVTSTTNPELQLQTYWLLQNAPLQLQICVCRCKSVLYSNITFADWKGCGKTTSGCFSYKNGRHFEVVKSTLQQEPPTPHTHQWYMQLGTGVGSNLSLRLPTTWNKSEPAAAKVTWIKPEPTAAN